MTIAHADSEAIKRAAQYLAQGQLVAFATETVYGLGADGRNDQAVALIYQAKQRPQFNPLILHVSDSVMAEAIAVLDERAHRLITAFWPGPLSLVVPRRPDAPLSNLATSGLPTVALRQPAHPVALALLRAFGAPIAAPSANLSGQISPTSAADVAETLGDKIAMILDGGDCQIGVESTIIDLSTAEPVILRAGAVGREEIEMVLNQPIGMFKKDQSDCLKAPGMMQSHYAPHSLVRLNAVSVMDDEVLLGFGATDLPVLYNLSVVGDLGEAAARLFRMLRMADHYCLAQGRRCIAVMPIPQRGLGVAINDRLTRAAAPRLIAVPLRAIRKAE